MSGAGEGREALELRFYFGERDRDGDRPLEAAAMDACERSGVWAAVLMRAVEGFGRSAVERTDRLLSLSEDAPLVVAAVGESGSVEALAEEVRGLSPEGLLTLEPVELAPTGSPPASAAVVGEPVGGSPGDGGRDVVRATIWGPRSGPRSPHLAAVDALHRHGADSATVLLGVDGVLRGERRRAGFFAANRSVPAITVAVGSPAAIDAAVAEVGASADLVTLSGVERNRRYATERLHGDEGVERSSRHAGASLHGRRVTLLTSEAAQGAGGPLYLEYVQALRRAGAPGATALRGVWGFRGGGEPHGDRVLALRRDVPLIVEAVDSPEGAGRWQQMAESLAGSSDVVHSLPIPRILALN